MFFMVLRLIPAWAGKTSSGTIVPAMAGAHPRVGGENFEATEGGPS